jgi:hypothetical protein
VTEVADLTIRKTKAVAIARALAMIAIISVAVAVIIVVRSIGSSRDGWRGVAEQEAAANTALRLQLDASDLEITCRSAAASNESAALGELTIHIGETAEAALRIAGGERLLPADIEQLVTSLHASSESVRVATAARARALSECVIPPTTTIPGD